MVENHISIYVKIQLPLNWSKQWFCQNYGKNHPLLAPQWFHIEGPIPLCSDNQAAIFLMINPPVERQTKHINIWHYYIWEQYEEKVIEHFHIAGEETCSPSPCQLSKWKSLGPKSDCHRYIWFSGSVEMEYREMLFRLETEHSDKELYQIIAQSRPV